MPRPKVAVVHPGLGFGGSEAAVLWTIEALKRDHDVTLISLAGVDLDRLNTYYDTALEPGDFSFRRVPLPLALRNLKKFDGLKGRFLLRYVQRAAAEFDVLISGYGPMDFGKPGIQRIADFSFVEEWRLDLNPTFRQWKHWFYGDTLARRAYLGFCDRIATQDPEAWKQNITVTNSEWSADRMLKKYGIPSKVLYAPVSGNYPSVPYADRENGFVCLSRISPEKRVHSIIEIVRQVRERGHDVHLHVLGGIDGSEYANQVRRLAEQYREWVFLEGAVYGDNKRQWLARHRFGLHARPNEPFGIAVAEMVLAGCIVFVPEGGGQVEIVNHPGLIFQSDEDAVEKIDAVLTHEAEREKLLDHLRLRSRSFSATSFMESIRSVVAEFAERYVAARS